MSPERTDSIQEFLRRLVTAISHAELYALEHAQVTRLCNASRTSLHSVLETSELSLMVVEDQLVVDDRPLPQSLFLSRFVKAMRNRGLGHVKLLQGLEVAELVALVGVLSRNWPQGQEIPSSPAVRFGRVEVRLSPQTEGSEDAGGDDEALPPVQLSEEDLAGFLELYEDVRRNNQLNVVGIRDIVSGFIDGFKLSGFIDTFRKQTDPLMALAPLRSTDEATFIHSTNVCILNLAQAVSLGIEGPLLHDIGIGAMLHDIGKLFLPSELLHKQGTLNPAEWEQIKQHPARGAEFLLDMPGVPKLAALSAFEHHLGFDLSGYPKVTPQWEQHLASQLTTISDYYDTLRTSHAGDGGIPLADISAFMLELAGSELHPQLTLNFLDLMTRVDNFCALPTS